MDTRLINKLLLPLVMISLIFMAGCSNDNDDSLTDINVISKAEKEALLFMLEEEKMARDVYYYLDDEWNRPEFKNISKSEASHMAAIENLLKLYGIEYDILTIGEFKNSDLQEAYLLLTELGKESLVTALLIGAGIEELDIYDLENYITSLDNTRINNVFSSLQCASGNHLRAFTTSLTNLGITFEPQFISDETYREIIQSDHENCNL